MDLFAVVNKPELGIDPGSRFINGKQDEQDPVAMKKSTSCNYLWSWLKIPVSLCFHTFIVEFNFSFKQLQAKARNRQLFEKIQEVMKKVIQTNTFIMWKPCYTEKWCVDAFLKKSNASTEEKSYRLYYIVLKYMKNTAFYLLKNLEKPKRINLKKKKSNSLMQKWDLLVGGRPTKIKGAWSTEIAIRMPDYKILSCQHLTGSKPISEYH